MQDIRLALPAPPGTPCLSLHLNLRPVYVEMQQQGNESPLLEPKMINSLPRRRQILQIPMLMPQVHPNFYSLSRT